MGPGLGRAHALSEEGCQDPGQGPRPGQVGPSPAALPAYNVGPARARAHVRYRFFESVYTYPHAYM